MKEGWIETKLSNCIKLKSGNNLTAKKMMSGAIPVYGGNGISGYHNEFNLEGTNIIIGRVGALCGNVRYIDESIWLTDNAFKISEYKYDFDHKFLTYLLNQVNLRSYARQSAQPVISNSSIKDVSLKFPTSVKEQTQIVATLDKTFKQIDQAKKNLEQNLNNAKELFQSKLNEVFSQRGEGWEEKTLKEVCMVERGSSPRPIKSFITEDEDGVNWIKIGDTKGIEKYIYKTNQKITKKGAEKSRFVDVGDFILSNSMSFGRPYIMKTQGYIHDGWFVFRLPENIDAEFFWYLLVSPNVKEQFQGLASGAIVKNISGDLVKKTILPIPVLSEQKKIVVELDNLSYLSNNLQTHYQQKLNNLEELKKSILQKAFRGEL